MAEVVDAVITWVDGQDPFHQKKRTQSLEKLPTSPHLIDASAPTRFNHLGEIDYCIASLLRFAPWINTLYIVTDAQTPPILATKPDHLPFNIVVVDHDIIFANLPAARPTFNSLTIESVLWRIPGLSNHFIYLNDDCFLTRPLSPEDFFNGDNLVLRGQLKRMRTASFHNKWQKIRRFFSPQKPVAPHRQLEEYSAKMAGYTHDFFQIHHAALALQVDLLANNFEKYRELFLKNLQYPFRHPDQFWTISFAYHKTLLEKKPNIDTRCKATYIHCGIHSSQRIKRNLDKIITNKHIYFLCIQSLDLASPATQKYLFEWLDDYIGLPW